MSKLILLVDMDNTLCDFDGECRKLIPGWDSLKEPHKREKTIELMETSKDFFLNLEPKPNAVSSFKTLSRLFDTYVVSTPYYLNPNSFIHKRLWVEEHLGDSVFNRLVLTSAKHLCKGDYLIDDRKVNGVEHFEGEWIPFGTESFPDWDIVRNYLINKVS